MLFLGLLLAALGGAATAAILTVRGLGAVLRKGERSRSGWLRAAALLAGAGAVAMYAWGLLHLGYAVMRAEDGGAGSFPIEPCREGGSQLASQVDGYGVSYVPLRFECHLSGGGTYVTSSVPGYVNPVTSVLGLITASCGVLAAATTQRARPPGV
ncbi:hypothetical protein GAR05_03223 [Micromonospora saelicesensis]|jgi:hypothetical protein|uniref:Uncharacterized protein n=1 Tax=Micromonospora saelicesensis TaxID=285676 RepID=A0ABX9CHN1_9ACTN|nr:hypothetical protein [Micromonospora saelicesensis]RAN98090.1 hypothetical protein GAR05_03223 [Micromonospora saelicesensis]RAO42488.1 hypothetical protein PSN01_06175 [Micromonospora saelicesensis]